MRWLSKVNPTPQVGDRQILTWFAWLPVKIGRENRWLERVTVEYECYRGALTQMLRWRELRFIDAS